MWQVEPGRQQRGPNPGAGTLATVRAWIDAFNERDRERLTALADKGFEHVRLSGEVLQRDQLAELLQRHSSGVGVVFRPRRYFCRGGTIVVDARIEWRDLKTVSAQ